MGSPPAQNESPWADWSDHLPPGFHDWTRAQIEQHLVTDMRRSTRRQRLLEGLDELCEALRAIGVEAEQWIGGGFASTDPEPNDLDLVDLISLDTLLAAHRTHGRQAERTLVNYHSKEETARLCGCDARLVIRFPEGHPSYDDFLKVLAFWHQRFGHDWLGQPRGIVRTNLALPQEQEQNEPEAVG